MISSARMVLSLSVVVVATLVGMPIQAVLLKVLPRGAEKLPVAWHRFVLKMFGIKVIIHGEPSSEHPLLLVANHTSWKDIIVLGSSMPLSFIAKSDMKSWPLIGQMARLQRTIFVEREQRRKTGQQASQIAERLGNGDRIVLFAEGTTSDGNKILPFNSSLLGAAQLAIRTSGKSSVFIQPVAIAYTKMHGVALGRYFRPEAAWPGDVPLASHVIHIVKQGALDVELHFGRPIAFDVSSNRKAITRQVEAEVRRMLNSSLRGQGHLISHDTEPKLITHEQQAGYANHN